MIRLIKYITGDYVMAKITITDIAKQAGVAKSTVSRYLNGGSVSKKTRLKIDQVVKDADYKPNAFAQSLKKQTSHTIGVIVPRLDSFAQTEMLRGLDAANQDDILLILNTYQDDDLVQNAIEQVDILGLGGVILFATNLTPTIKDALHALDVPVVIQGQNDPAFARVIVDDNLAGSAIGHVAANSTNTLIISVDPQQDFEVGAVRYQAVTSQLTKHYDTVYADFSLATAKQVTTQALATTRYDTIIALSDLMAAGALQSLKNANVNVPEDTSVYGFGGTLISDLVSPNITTFAFDYFAVGQQLYHLFKQQQIKPEPTKIIIGGTLVNKQSN